MDSESDLSCDSCEEAFSQKKEIQTEDEQTHSQNPEEFITTTHYHDKLQTQDMLEEILQDCENNNFESATQNQDATSDANNNQHNENNQNQKINETSDCSSTTQQTENNENNNSTNSCTWKEGNHTSTSTNNNIDAFEVTEKDGLSMLVDYSNNKDTEETYEIHCRVNQNRQPETETCNYTLSNKLSSYIGPDEYKEQCFAENGREYRGKYWNWNNEKLDLTIQQRIQQSNNKMTQSDWENFRNDLSLVMVVEQQSGLEKFLAWKCSKTQHP